MLCALNLDRASFLPRNRLELYVTALSMLLERRDTQRGIPTSVKLTDRDSRQLLRHLAWRLSVNGRSELMREEAVRRLGERLATMPRVDHDAERLLDHLVQRSGVLRAPTAGRIDFVHRTFQEFLTAEEAADQGDVGLLVQNAHLDQWRDIVVMAAGLANAPLRQELFEGLFDRAEAEPRTRRKLHLLAAAATESAPALTVALADRMERSLAELIPPRRVVEARSLAAAGEALLPRLRQDPSHLSEAAAAAVVRTAALINGAEAWTVLERFSRDPRPRVQKELIAAWKYFDPDEYAARVLADAPLLDGKVTVDDQALLTAITRLRNLSELRLNLGDVRRLDFLPGLPHLRGAQLSGDFEDLAPLAQCAEMDLLLVSSRHALDPTPITSMPALRRLFFYPAPASVENLDFLGSLTHLPMLGLLGLEELDDFSPLGNMRALTHLSLYGYPDGTDLGMLGNLPGLRKLDLGRSANRATLGVLGGLSRVAATLPGVEELGFLYVSPLTDLDQLTRCTALSELSIRFCDVLDLTSLTAVPSLRTLEITTPVAADFLAQIKRLPQLSTLEILSDDRDIDLSALGDVPLTVRIPPDRHRLLGAGKRIKVEWF